MKCRIAGDELKELFTLGDPYVSNFIPADSTSAGKCRGDLTLAIGEESGLVQLTNNIDFDEMYRDYWYSSGTNSSMKVELRDIVESVSKNIDLSMGDKWLDIGCNDRTLLNFVQDGVLKVGADPSNVAKKASRGTDILIPDYFTKESVKDYGKFKVITAIAMFYDLDNPKEFLRDIYESLEDDGLFVVQMSYLPLMIEQLAFDNICHEHLTYYSLNVMRRLLDPCGFKVVDCKINDTNGGSFRVYIQKKIADRNSFGTAPFRDVANFRVQSVSVYEESLKLENRWTYIEFHHRVLQLKKVVLQIIKNIKSEGKSIWGYGASTKGNTLLQFFGLDNTLIDGIAERQPKKYGLKTIGTEIPIYSEAEMRNANPDYLLILPWHFINEFKDREQDYIDNGGKLIVPCPRLEIIEK